MYSVLQRKERTVPRMLRFVFSVFSISSGSDIIREDNVEMCLRGTERGCVYWMNLGQDWDQ
jgi:hypothetical protein